MMENGLHHLGCELNSRTAFLLESKGLLRNVQRASTQMDVGSIVGDPDHPKRLSTEWGPLVFVREEETRTGVVTVADLLIDPDARWRQAALDHIERGLGELTPRTREVIKENRERLGQSQRPQWLRPAVSIYDAVTVDLFFDLAGVQQSVDRHYDEGFNYYWPRLLRPSLSSIDSIRPPVWNPREQTEEVEKCVRECVQRADTLIEAVDAFYVKCGHVPLRATLSVPQVVVEWLERSSTSEDVWGQIWAWANKEPDPVRRYHACSVFLHEPRFLPEHAAGEFWSEVAKTVSSSLPGLDDPSPNETWRLRCDLARHYCQYLECIVPGQDGEIIAALAWWLSLQVADAFSGSELDIKDLCEQDVHPFVVRSSELRRLVHPPTKGSALRYATIFLPSVWSFSLLCQVGHNVASLHTTEMDEADRTAITRSMSEWLLAGVPRSANDSLVVYASDNGLTSSAHDWITAVRETAEEADLGAVIRLKTRADNLEELLDVIGRLSEFSPSMQFLIASCLGGAVYSDLFPVDALRDKLQDSQWRESAFLQGSLETTATLCDLLIEAQARANDDWRTHLPHFFAMACEMSPGEHERQQLLFAFVVLSSISTDTVSALRRLLRGRHRHTLRKYVQAWKTNLESLIETAEPWIAARMRPALGELSAVV
ncbi:MAG: hypothetical protein HQ582_04300 [Planctomycetes bacterium]|nr:hypothetical protein [Planctomycetota bacterium]